MTTRFLVSAAKYAAFSAPGGMDVAPIENGDEVSGASASESDVTPTATSAIDAMRRSTPIVRAENQRPGPKPRLQGTVSVPEYGTASKPP